MGIKKWQAYLYKAAVYRTSLAIRKAKSQPLQSFCKALVNREKEQEKDSFAHENSTIANQNFCMPKLIFLIIAGLFFSLSGRADDKVVPGYLIKSTGDTVPCNISVGRKIRNYSPDYRMSIVDSAGNKTTYKSKSKDIMGFGFVYEGMAYDYVCLFGEDKRQPPFAFRETAGKRLTLYTYTEVVPGYKTSSTITHYVLINHQGDTLSVSNQIFSPLKSKLRKYFRDDKELLDLEESDVYRAPDLIAFAKKANEM